MRSAYLIFCVLTVLPALAFLGVRHVTSSPPTSDIDILVEFGNDSGYQAFCKSVDAAVELEQELHRPVDLALSIDPRMWQYIEPDLIELPL